MEYTNGPQATNETRERLDAEAKPMLEKYIEDHYLDGATVVNRFVIQRSESRFLVQTKNGVRSISFDKQGDRFSVYPSSAEPWIKTGGQGASVSEVIDIDTVPKGGKIVGMTIGGLSSRGVSKVEGPKMDGIQDVTLDVPGGSRMAISISSGKLRFEEQD